jgi:hypothetical protein
MGVIPVLSTIPPYEVEGYQHRPAELNAIVFQVALEYDVPVWDYWSALQTLPNLGLGSDFIHPSKGPDPADFTRENLHYGYTVRNLLALKALDAVWRFITS